MVRASPLEQASRIAQTLRYVEEVRVLEDTLRLTVDPGLASKVVREFVAHDVDVSEVRSTGRSLEEVFFQLTEDS